jgi:cytochrome c-type biogenesis protein
VNGLAETAAAGPLALALGLCVLAGLVSFASPCVVPLVPGYLSYLAAWCSSWARWRCWG